MNKGTWQYRLNNSTPKRNKYVINNKSSILIMSVLENFYFNQSDLFLRSTIYPSTKQNKTCFYVGQSYCMKPSRSNCFKLSFILEWGLFTV